MLDESIPADATTTFADYNKILRDTRAALNDLDTAITALGGVITSDNDLTIPGGTTSLSVGEVGDEDLADQAIELINLTACGACTLGSITGGRAGQVKIFIFQDANVTITNGATIALNRTGNLVSAANM